MKKVLVLVVLALASFAVYFLYEDLAQPVVPVPASVKDAGLAWFEGNASKAFFVVDGGQAAQVRVAMFREPIPQNVYVVSDSDQRFFPDFLDRFQARLGSFGVGVKPVPLEELTRLEPPGVLVVASSAVPARFLSSGALAHWIESGGVLLHVGLPFSFVWNGRDLAANPAWSSQKEAVGVDFVSSDFLSGYRLEAVNGSAFRRGNWEVFKNQGYLAVFPRPLDQGFSSGFSAGDAVADFVLNASWQAPLSTFDERIDLPHTVFSPPVFAENLHALVFLEDANGSRRLHFSLRRSDVRVLHPGTSWVNESVSVSLFLNRSLASRFTYFLVQDGRVMDFGEFGSASSGLSLLSKGIFLNASGDFVLFFSDGSVPSYSVLHVQAPTVRIVKADAATKRIHAEVRVDGVPYARQAVAWNGSTFYTDAGGSFRFEDPSFQGDGESYVFQVGPVPVAARIESTAGFLSSWPDRLMVAGALALFAVALVLPNRLGGFVRVLASERLRVVRRTFSAEFLAEAVESVGRAFGWTRMPVRLDELKTHLERRLRDPHAVILPESLAHAVAHASTLVLEGDLVACRSWFSTKKEQRDAFFRRRLLDVLVTSGWRVSWTKAGVRATRGKKAVLLQWDVDRGQVKTGARRWLSLSDLEDFLRA